MPVFFQRLIGKNKHLKYIQDFSNNYNLGYKFELGKDDNIAPIMLALDGHIVIKTSHDFISIMVSYIPSLITSKQKKWLDDNLGKFKNYDYLGFNNYSYDDDNKIKTDTIEDFDKELLEIDKRYNSYKLNKENNGNTLT